MYRKSLLKKFIPLGLFSLCAMQSTPEGGMLYRRAMRHYRAGYYEAASELFTELLPQVQGEREEADVYFYRAYCSFHNRKYKQSAARFKRFCHLFPRDPRVEEATYKRCHALCLKSPNVERDQTVAREALCSLREYLEIYPQGRYVDQARTQLKEMHDKVALKDFNNARCYYAWRKYRAAVVSLDNFQKEFRGTPHDEEVAYLKADAQYQYYQEVKIQGGENSEQLLKAVGYCRAFLDGYPESSYRPLVSELYEQLIDNYTKKHTR